MSDLELHELFDNTFDCYTYYEDDYMEEVKEPAMTKATFVVEVFKLLRKQANDVRTGDRQLTIPDVSQQRELLLAFAKWEYESAEFDDTNEYLVDKFLGEKAKL